MLWLCWKFLPWLAPGPTTLKSETSALLTDRIIYKLRLDALHKARLEAVKTIAESRALVVETDQIVERSRSPAIQHRTSQVRTQVPQFLSPRKMRSLHIQAQHECQRFLQVAAGLTEIAEHCAETITNSVQLLHRSFN
jgi:hypothetical protein